VLARTARARVTAGFADTERYDAARHDVTSFGCGNDLLDRWLVRYAGQNQRRDAARTFVAATSDDRVYGYYALLAGQLAHHEATPENSEGLSRRFPIPVAILARLAVDLGQQGQGIGAALLNDALVRIVQASEQVAVRAVVVHAVDENASPFYGRFGFRALSAAPRTLMAPVAALRAAGYS
jgi:predicted N-acetyltransferase YhbS